MLKFDLSTFEECYIIKIKISLKQNKGKHKKNLKNDKKKIKKKH